MRSHTVFKDFGRGRSRLEHPGYWQKQVADDLIFARGLLQANWHPGLMQNRPLDRLGALSLSNGLRFCL